MSTSDTPSWRGRFKISIVGGGLVGLATAIFLQRGGFAVTVLEKDAELRMVGTGLQLPATHNKVLEELGILDQVAAHSMFPHNIILHKYNSGQELFVMNLMPYVLDTYKIPHFVAHRADLRKSLAGKYEALGGKIRFGVTIDFAKSRLAEGLIKFSDGSELDSDLVIGADGENSKCREFLLGRKDEPKPSGRISNRVVIDEKLALDDPELRPLYDPPCIRTWLGPDCQAITYLMHGKINVAFNRPMGDAVPFVGPRPVDVDELRQFTRGWEPRIRKLIGLGTSYLKWVSYEASRLDEWVHPEGRLVLVGDSAHAMLHFLAHGAAMGMESASVLGNLLLQTQSPAQVHDVLRLYNKCRLPRTEIVRRASKKMGDIWHMPDGPVCDERDRELLNDVPTIGFPNLLSDPCFQSWLWSYDPKEEAEIMYASYFGGKDT